MKMINSSFWLNIVKFSKIYIFLICKPKQMVIFQIKNLRNISLWFFWKKKLVKSLETLNFNTNHQEFGLIGPPPSPGGCSVGRRETGLDSAVTKQCYLSWTRLGIFTGNGSSNISLRMLSKKSREITKTFLHSFSQICTESFAISNSNFSKL